MTYAEKLQDERWLIKRLEILKRDKYICHDCGDRVGHMEVHHIRYMGRDPWDCHNIDLITLCVKCHKARHSKKRLEEYEPPY